MKPNTSVLNGRRPANCPACDYEELSLMMQGLVIVMSAACVAVNVPGMVQGYWWSWASGVFCALLFAFNCAAILRH